MPPAVLVILYMVTMGVILIQNSADWKKYVPKSITFVKEDPLLARMRREIDHIFADIVDSPRMKSEKIQELDSLKQSMEEKRDEVWNKVEYTKDIPLDYYVYAILAALAVFIFIIWRCFKRKPQKKSEEGRPIKQNDIIHHVPVPTKLELNTDNTNVSTTTVMEQNLDPMESSSVDKARTNPYNAHELDAIAVFMNMQQGEDEKLKKFSERLTKVAKKAFQNTHEDINNVLIQKFLHGMTSDSLREEASRMIHRCVVEDKPILFHNILKYVTGMEQQSKRYEVNSLVPNSNKINSGYQSMKDLNLDDSFSSEPKTLEVVSHKEALNILTDRVQNYFHQLNTTLINKDPTSTSTSSNQVYVELTASLTREALETKIQELLVGTPATELEEEAIVKKDFNPRDKNLPAIDVRNIKCKGKRSMDKFRAFIQECNFPGLTDIYFTRSNATKRQAKLRFKEISVLCQVVDKLNHVPYEGETLAASVDLATIRTMEAMSKEYAEIIPKSTQLAGIVAPGNRAAKCFICLELYRNVQQLGCLTGCGHVLCKKCVVEVQINADTIVKCPVCKKLSVNGVVPQLYFS